VALVKVFFAECQGARAYFVCDDVSLEITEMGVDSFLGNNNKRAMLTVDKIGNVVVAPIFPKNASGTFDLRGLNFWVNMVVEKGITKFKPDCRLEVQWFD
jgi:hypothetical protein